MSDVIPVRIPQETVNDDMVLIQEWKVADGQHVTPGQVLVEVETSKSVFEIVSPVDGFVRLNAESDQEVPIGRILCYIGATLAALDSAKLAFSAEQLTPADCASLPLVGQHGSTGSTLPSSFATDFTASQLVDAPSQTPGSDFPAQSTRFSRQAIELIEQLGLSTSAFSGKGLVRREDVLQSSNVPVAQANVVSPQTTPPVKSPSNAVAQFRPAVGVSSQAQKLTRSKKLETRALSWSTQQAIRSSVTVSVPTVGRDQLQLVSSDAIEQATANLIRSCAMLLRQFPLLNGCCIEDQVMIYDQVNIGYALDAGRGLKVAAIRDADQKTTLAIAGERQRLISAYLNDAMLPSDLAGATFTITDLSGSRVTTFDPLISEGQAGILGIGGEFSSAGGQQAYHLVLSFDHRMVEGRAAASFLNKLTELAVAFEAELLRSSSGISSKREARCQRCGISLSEATRRNHFLVQVADAQAASVTICTVCLQGR